jgi:hypothetical protein
MTEPTPRTPRTTTSRRTIVLGVVLAIVIVLAVGASIAFSLASQPAEPATSEPTAAGTPSPSPSAIPSASTAPEATPTAAPTPTASPSAKPAEPTKPLPTDCRKIYTTQFLELWAGQPLNDPSLVGVGISRYESVETIRDSLPGIECKWGEATEGGMSNAVNQVTRDTQAAMTAAATAEGFRCAENGAGATVCGISVGPADGDEWVVAEELYFRDGLVVTTWRASTAGSIADSSRPVYDTLWP